MEKLTVRVKYPLLSQDSVVALGEPPCRRSRQASEKLPSATFSDERPNRPSFLILPPEIRLPIYRHLLVTNRTILHAICPSAGELRIVEYVEYGRTVRHYLHPEILETCRLINEEGTPLLYGENTFRRQFSWPRGPYRPTVCRNWRLSDRSLQYISRIWIFRQYNMWHAANGDLRVLNDFPALKVLEVEIDLNDDGASLETWETLVKAVVAKRPTLSSFRCEICLSFSDAPARDWLARCEVNQSLNFDLHKCWVDYYAAWIQENGILPPGRSLQWSFRTEAFGNFRPSCYVYLKIE
ncbi:hypothetical protein FGG08_002508 [Glutinoglossum americanum]|uniref:Uncharacterized protein n=1 Tax=Glutinoglossum americanum TaxID=1670608 RepID=A0A9P8I4Q0_9PEZI|nr:hypothetical protein FGG08_002508 [Glutinoglossum americanum]